MVAVISHELWTSEFGRLDVVGRTLKIATSQYTIIGVAPTGFRGTAEGGAPDVFVPITTIPTNLGPWAQSSYLADYRWDWTSVLVRRKAGINAAVAGRELTAAYVQSRAEARLLNPRVLPDSLAPCDSGSSPLLRRCRESLVQRKSTATHSAPTPRTFTSTASTRFSRSGASTFS